ncbi:MAG: L-threonylcarbamoyladenylate synthase [Anaerolineae bacterium]
MTRVLRVDPQDPDPDVVAQAAAVIREGGLVAFPTETVYGLGANALDVIAVSGIFRAKARPAFDPLIVHLVDAAQLDLVVAETPDVTWELAREFWPGPLTLVLPRGERIPQAVTAGGDTVAVRVPSHPVAHALIAAAGVPIAAPSANRFGHVSPTSAEHVLADLGGRIDVLLDGGSTPVGVESTVLSLIDDPPRILRPGGVSREALERVLGVVEVAQHAVAEEASIVSPGTTAKHYAPRAKVIFFSGEREPMLAAMRGAAQEQVEAGEKVGLLLAEEDVPTFRDLPVEVEAMGSLTSMAQIAQQLFASLRALEQSGVSVILARDFGPAGLGLAVRDRLTRAAGGHVVVVDEDNSERGECS